MKNTQRYWHNFKTGKHEWQDAPTTDAEALELLPQSPSAHGLYQIYREYFGKSIIEAMIEVLTASTGGKRANV